MRHFGELVSEQWKSDRYICVGLDVDPDRMPVEVRGRSPVDRCRRFLEGIVEATSTLAAAYKPNLSFFEALGADGLRCLRDIIALIQAKAPTIPVIADAKRGDIASTNNGYVQLIFEYLRADAVTLHPYLGHEALAPFLKRAEKGCFILCRTSNPGAAELQDLDVKGEPLFLRLVTMIANDWNVDGNCGLVVGATYPEELRLVRDRVPTMPLLIPGVGAQGGTVERTVRAALHGNSLNALINSSRGILYAGTGKNYADSAEAALQILHQEAVDTIRGHRGNATQ